MLKRFFSSFIFISFIKSWFYKPVKILFFMRTVKYSWFLFWTGQKAKPTLTRGPSVHQTKAHRLREHTNSNACHLTEARVRASDTGTPHTCPPMGSWWCATSHGDGYSHTHLYKGDLASPSSYDSLFPHFSHIPFHFPYWLERWNANAPFVPPRRLIATESEHFPPPLLPSVPHRTDRFLIPSKNIFWLRYI